VNPKKDDEIEDNILMDEVLAEEIETSVPQDNYKSKTLEELHTMLDKAVANEDYEVAARIRDEISKR
jgi:excinuclease UvrABC helicase subunit UvrB